MKYIIAVLVTVTLFISLIGYGQIPMKISYQGLLTTSSGTPLQDGSYDLKFEIYNALSGGTLRYTETQSGISVQRGTFNVILDTLTNIFSEKLFVEVTVLAGPGISSPMTFSPRSELTTAPYAFRAMVADSVVGGSGGATGIVSVDGVANAGGNVDFIPGTNISIVPNDGANTVTFSSSLRGVKVFTVAPSGADFTTISEALDSCINPSPVKTYYIRVLPGTYTESFTCKKYVTLQGSGKYTSFVKGTITGEDSCIIDGFNIEGSIICIEKSPTITHNIIRDGNGIYLSDGAKPWIKQNEILNNLVWGIDCDGWGTDPWIIANKIMGNISGGIRCNNSSPTISNNQILENENYGIYLIGAEGQPTEPTIDDNVIGHTEVGMGIGIYMEGYAEPRIIANDIYVNTDGIVINMIAQPSILGNDINYNHRYGINSQTVSSPVMQRATIHGNHIHRNGVCGILSANSDPVISANNITNNVTDINYMQAPFKLPTINQNTFDIRVGLGAPGRFNATSNGLVIAP